MAAVVFLHADGRGHALTGRATIRPVATMVQKTRIPLEELAALPTLYHFEVSHRGDTESRSARSGDLKSDRSASGTVSASGNGAVANEIPDGNDDDVIARRLRKAAEQETDPELKDKLWKEYVEYKKNTPGG